VYIVERLFDAGSMALIFSIAMLWIPEAEVIKATSHSAMVSTMELHSPFLAAFFAATADWRLPFQVRCSWSRTLVGWCGGHILRARFRPRFKEAGTAIGEKIRTFHSGLDTMRSFSEFAVTASLSLVCGC